MTSFRDMKIKVAVTTLGCKVNQYESAGILKGLGEDFEIVPFSAPADIYIVNTCTVTERTDYQSRQLIRRANRMNPNAAIIVTGCYAQTDPDRVSGLPGVVLVAGTDQKDLLPESVRRIAFGPLPDREETERSEGRQANTGFGYAPDIRLPGHTRGFLKIQDGCEAFCSYCIVPYARGRSRSLDPGMVLHRLAALAQAGFREVVLSGIHLGMYGQELHPKITLLDLLRKIEGSGIPLSRLRLSSIEPTEITQDLIAHISRSRLICRHFHIPLQSGSNKILTMMNRCYTIHVFREVVEKIASVLPDACIGIDVMAGFPGETEKDFRETADLLQDLPASYFHVFPYSRRPGTKAASMPGQVSERLKKERASILRKLGDEKRRAILCPL